MRSVYFSDEAAPVPAAVRELAEEEGVEPPRTPVAAAVAGGYELVVSEGPAVIETVIVGRGAADTTIRIYDGQDATGERLFDLDASVPRQWDTKGRTAPDGIFAVLTGSLDAAITIGFQD